MFRANNFDKLLDKATSNLRLDPDWPTILQICDLIRQNDCTPKYAIAGIKKKLYSQNPHQAMFALLTLESVVKNCGSGVHDEVASKPFCEMLRDLVKTTQHENLRNKILELVQAWAFAFRKIPKYRSVQDIVNILKAEGYKFPSLKESDAMFSADTAPEWADGEVCHRCRVAFSLMVRRHHCRACGQVFCQQCSSKTSTLPKFGIEKEVRVCDACYDKVSRPPSAATGTKLEILDTASDYGPAQPQSPQKRPGKSAEELQEEEELQLALALSQSEAEEKEKEKQRRTRSHIAPNPAPQHPTVSPSPSSVSASPEHSNTANSELSRYLDRGYWEQRSQGQQAAPTAPQPHSHASTASEDYSKPMTTNVSQEEEAEDKEIDEFVTTLRSQIEIFVNRMKSNSSRGRSIANDTAVQSLFMNITAMHSRLLRYIQQQDDRRVYLESLQDKVTQIRDSRAALDTLRAEHAARLAAAAEAAERQRQMQMAAKLDAMRKKKHEYLQYQRQLALQRVQEQEREMQMRQEQQKHQYMMSANSGYYMPGVSMHQYQPGFSSQPLYANPQYHQMMPQTQTTEPAMQSMPQASVNPMSTASMPQLTQSFPMSTPSGVSVNKQSNTQPQMPRQPLTQQMSMPPMMLPHHQMRIPVPGHPMMTQNGLPQNIQQNGHVKPNQPGMMPQIPNIGPPQMNLSNPMLIRMPMINQPNQHIPVTGYASHPVPGMTSQVNIQQPMSLPGQMLPGQMPMQHPTSQSVQGPHAPSLGQPSQAQMPQMGNQPMSHPNQIPGQLSHPNQQMPGQIPPQGQNIPQHTPNQQMPNQGPGPQGQMNQAQFPQHMQNNQGLPMPQGPMSLGQQMPQQGQHMPPQNQPQPGHPMPQLGQPMPQPGQPMPQPGQPMPQQGQTMPQQGQQMPPQGHQVPQQMQNNQGQQIPPQGQMPQGQQMPTPQGQQMPPPQGQQMPPQGPQMPQQMLPQGHQMPQMPQGQMQMPQMPQGPMKPPQQNFVPQPNQNQAQTPVKAENNNSTAELISFD